ncbi:ORC2-domain-containing protein [Xylariomycetidae sp. FL0641]|nr:ORC2-domain-containing protein [Xylariomycetidae sp. FL0641]
MPRPRKAQTLAERAAPRSSTRKRSRDEAAESAATTPSKRGSTRAGIGSQASNSTAKKRRDIYDIPSDEDEDADGDEFVTATENTPAKSGRTTAASTPRTKAGEATTPKGRKSKEGTLSTPSKVKANGTPNAETPRWKRNDRSARKKSARALIEKVVAGEASDEEADEDIEREIYESSEDEEQEEAEEAEGEHEAEDEEVPDEAATPSKKRRGRPKASGTTATKKVGRKRKNSPTPPRDLPPHEQYFAQNRPGAANKTSSNTLSGLGLQLLTHEEYFDVLRTVEGKHTADVAFLQAIHERSFPQWAFELSQGFGLCLYGYGSKRALLHRFARYLWEQQREREKAGDANPRRHRHRIVVVNGYVRTTTLREVLSTLASAIDASHRLPAGGAATAAASVLALLAAHPTTAVTLIVHSIDAPALRKPGIQPVLAQLAAHPRVRLACSADTADFALLWDAGLRAAFAFLFHDATTFAPLEVDAVDDVHELLGRARARRVAGREGVAFVLRSLPENARSLFRLLVGEVLVLMEEDGDGGGAEGPGVEYRMLYQKAVEEFVCSSEMAFRTLLKEFHDHQIITSRKDVLGTELLSVPFRKEELEAILEDLVS